MVTKSQENLKIAKFLLDHFLLGILFYVTEDIPAKLLSAETLPTESSFAEINLRK